MKYIIAALLAASTAAVDVGMLPHSRGYGSYRAPQRTPPGYVPQDYYSNPRFQRDYGRPQYYDRKPTFSKAQEKKEGTKSRSDLKKFDVGGIYSQKAQPKGPIHPSRIQQVPQPLDSYRPPDPTSGIDSYLSEQQKASQADRIQEVQAQKQVQQEYKEETDEYGETPRGGYDYRHVPNYGYQAGFDTNVFRRLQHDSRYYNDQRRPRPAYQGRVARYSRQYQPYSPYESQRSSYQPHSRRSRSSSRQPRSRPSYYDPHPSRSAKLDSPRARRTSNNDKRLNNYFNSVQIDGVIDKKYSTNFINNLNFVDDLGNAAKKAPGTTHKKRLALPTAASLFDSQSQKYAVDHQLSSVAYFNDSSDFSFPYEKIQKQTNEATTDIVNQPIPDIKDHQEPELEIPESINSEEEYNGNSNKSNNEDSNNTNSKQQ